MGEAKRKEEARLAELDRLSAVQPETDHVLQKAVDEVREAFGVELCMVNLVTKDAQYFRAWSGDIPEELAEPRAVRNVQHRHRCRLRRR